jgi:hypothetical protein
VSRPPHRARWALALLVTALVGWGTTDGAVADPTPTGPDPTRATGAGVYLVTLDRVPAAAYTGGVPGYRATMPRPSAERFDRSRPAVAAYQGLLQREQDRVLEQVGSPEVLYRYYTALDGFAAALSGDQVKRLRALPGVALVERSTKQAVTRTRTPALHGMPDAGLSPVGVAGRAHAGRGQVVGVVDTGIWPENPSFAGLPQRAPGTSARLPGFHGSCAAADHWAPSACNDTLVSARFFVRGFGQDAVASAEHLSARDAVGHGSHTASTVAGNGRVRVTIDDRSFGRTSGVAPAARLAVYKACWAGPDPEQDGCATADTVAAVDRAVADGVDVLAFPISGSRDPSDSVSRAFLNAAAAGVFVAASAGNTGPSSARVGHVAPWVTTVGASTHTTYQGGVRLGDGTLLVGAMVSDRPVTDAPLVLGADAAAPGADPGQAARCEIGSLDAEVVEDAVVVCDRGVVARVDKSTAVARAGGVGMVLLNTGPDTVDADVHAVPTVHLDVADAGTVRGYLRDAGDDATASLDPSAAEDVPVPAVAEFSARGPGGAGVLKPDLVAPGVSVLGAVAPASDSGRLWDLASGTSASTGYVAGLAADVLAAHPRWTPGRVRSAMATTAAAAEDASAPHAQGSGVVDPRRVLDPGLVFDSGLSGWRKFADGRIRAVDLNQPSVVVDSLVGRTTVVRRLTNVSSGTETYTASAAGLDGIEVTVRPRTVTLRPGATRRVRIVLAATPGSPVNDYAKGRLTWTGLTHQARIPLAVRPTVVTAPEQVEGSGETGHLVVHGRSGTGRPVELHGTRLVPSTPTGLTLVPGQFDPAMPERDGDTFGTDVDVPSGTAVARFVIGSHNPGDDVDLYVYRDGALVDSDTGDGPSATVTLTEPADGDYTVFVNAHVAGNGSTTTGQLFTWVVDGGDGDDLALTPESVGDAPGDAFRYSASWEGLDPTRRWLGVVTYGDSDRHTLLQIN